MRVWQQPVEVFLQGGLSVLPVAPVSNVGPDRLAQVLRAVAERLRRKATPEQTATLWKATTILLSLRYEKEQVERIVREVSTMSFGIRGIEESWLYQEYFQKGKAEGEAEGLVAQARDDLLRAGRKKLGPPSEVISGQIAKINDRDRLAALLERIFDVSTWDDLLAQSGS